MSQFHLCQNAYMNPLNYVLILSVTMKLFAKHPLFFTQLLEEYHLHYSLSAQF